MRGRQRGRSGRRGGRGEGRGRGGSAARTGAPGARGTRGAKQLMGDGTPGGRIGIRNPDSGFGIRIGIRRCELLRQQQSGMFLIWIMRDAEFDVKNKPAFFGKINFELKISAGLRMLVPNIAELVVVVVVVVMMILMMMVVVVVVVVGDGGAATRQKHPNQFLEKTDSDRGLMALTHSRRSAPLLPGPLSGGAPGRDTRSTTVSWE